MLGTGREPATREKPDDKTPPRDLLHRQYADWIFSEASIAGPRVSAVSSNRKVGPPRREAFCSAEAHDRDMGQKSDETRYAHRSGSGSNEPKHAEKKEEAPDWKSRQGGDQPRDDPGDATSNVTSGKGPRGNDEVGARRHLEGSEQGPS